MKVITHGSCHPGFPFNEQTDFYRDSTNTEVVRAGTLKQPEVASYVEFLIMSVEFIWRCKSEQ